MSRVSPFPPNDLEEALQIGRTIWTNNGGKAMRRLSVFNVLGRSPSSSTSRGLLTASASYGLTKGIFDAEQIELTERGQMAASTGDPRARLHAVFEIPVFRAFFEGYRNRALPSETAALDFLRERGLSERGARECLKVLLKSGEQVSLIQEISGAKRVVSYEAALEKHAVSPDARPDASDAIDGDQEPAQAVGDIGDSRSGPSGVDAPARPALHIDIQIHIAAEAKPEQIDLVFASMAKHLYGRS